MISLIILGFNRFGTYTQPCLDSILSAVDLSHFEVILVDNGSIDDSAEQARAYCRAHPSVLFYSSPTNLGFAGGMNLGVGLANGDWVVLVNNDTLFPAESLNRFQLTLENAPSDIGIIGPVTNAAGNGQKLNLGELTTAQILAFGEELAVNPTGLLFDTYRTDFFCVAIRRKMWDELSGLDTRFGRGYYEDFDFSLRARKMGWRQAITEDVFVAHIGSASFGEIPKEQKQLIKDNKSKLKSLHPDVRFEHQREGNLSILMQYMHYQESGEWLKSQHLRLERRLINLNQDYPRSLIKRLKWHWKCRKVKRFFQYLQ